MRIANLLLVPVAFASVLSTGTQPALASLQDKDAALALLHIKHAEPYAVARTKLLRDGWKPVRSSGERGFIDGILQAGWVEVSNCSGTSLGFCTFDWKRRGQCARVVTYGEFLPEHGAPKVNGAMIGNCSKVLAN
jgi:hypothetical protein